MVFDEISNEGEVIERVDSYSYLRIMIDDKVTLEVHVNNIIKKLLQSPVLRKLKVF